MDWPRKFLKFLFCLVITSSTRMSDQQRGLQNQNLTRIQGRIIEIEQRGHVKKHIVFNRAFGGDCKHEWCHGICQLMVQSHQATFPFLQDFNLKRKKWIKKLRIHEFYSNATKNKKQRKPKMQQQTCRPIFLLLFFMFFILSHVATHAYTNNVSFHT